jgi:protein disulfide-isomerase-like protein
MNKFIKKTMNKTSKTLKTMLKKKNLPKVLLLLAVLLVLIFIRKRFLVSEGFESSPSNFGTDVESGKKLVLFYADWCGHCKRFKPDWDDLSKEMNKDDKKMVKVNLGGDDSKNEEIMAKYNVDGFPTVALLNNGNLQQVYQGERTKSGLKEFMTSNQM